ncbi:MAG: hypothetical protein MZV63_03760 [Marinilabiliales bacterium]|nr:hypothetical protein [Marinilabiliales bacterium]
MESFIVFQNSTGIPKYTFPSIKNASTNSTLEGFFKELLLEMNKGTIPTMPPEQFPINITSMCSFPLITRPLIQRTFNMDDDAYIEFIKNRKAGNF